MHPDNVESSVNSDFTLAGIVMVRPQPTGCRFVSSVCYMILTELLPHAAQRIIVQFVTFFLGVISVNSELKRLTLGTTVYLGSFLSRIVTKAL